MNASPAVMQEMTYAVVRKGQTFIAYVKKTHGGGKRNSSKPTYFKCGRMEHMQRMCPGKDKQEGAKKGSAPPSSHKDGTALTGEKDKKSENKTKN